MSNCPYVPCGKKCFYEEHAKDLVGCYVRILNYRISEAFIKVPVLGRFFEVGMCDMYEEVREECDVK